MNKPSTFGTKTITMVMNQLTKWEPILPVVSAVVHFGIDIGPPRYLSSDQYYPVIWGFFHKPWNKDHPVMNQPGFNESCHVDGIKPSRCAFERKNPSESLSPVSDRTRSEQRVTIRFKSTKWWFFQRNEHSDPIEGIDLYPGQIIATSAEVNPKMVIW